MSTSDSVWAILDIPPTTDGAIIRRAYAAKLRVTRPEDDRAGFERLRAAYELAMRLIRGEAIESPVSMASRPPPREHSGASNADADSERLRAALMELESILRSDEANSRHADNVLARILESPALDNLVVEQRVQQHLASLLAASLPVSDPLLSRADLRFRWSHPEAQLDLTPATAAILHRLNDLAFLDLLRSDKNPYSPAFRRLQRRKIPLISWMAVHFSKAGVPGEYQLLQLLRIHHPSLLSLLEPSTIIWWDRLASRPRVSFPIICVGVMIAAISALIFGTTEGAMKAVTSAGSVMAVFAALALWKLFLLDWPRHLIRTRLPMPSPLLRAGWLPAGLLLLVVALLIPAGGVLHWIVAGLSLCTVQWAWIFVSMDIAAGRSNLLAIPLFRVVVFDFLAALWWLSSLSSLPPASQLQLPVLCALVASSLGLPTASAIWERQSSSRQRWYWLCATLTFAGVTLACLWWLSPNEPWRPFCAGLVIITIVMHRPVATMLSRRQQEVRFGWMVTCFIGIIIAAGQHASTLPQRNFALIGFGSLLTTTVFLCILMAIWNEYRGRIAPHREYPLHESLSW